jgi:hypothetical protein
MRGVDASHSAVKRIPAKAKKTAGCEPAVFLKSVNNFKSIL